MSPRSPKQVANGRASLTKKTSKWQFLWGLENKKNQIKIQIQSPLTF